jgi:predicted unusual protein kinase regulating ubiquinone biosynthesis (AarF/ABC1/UbiB family)
MVFNATINNISAISWQSVLIVEEAGDNHRPATNYWQTLLHNVVSWIKESDLQIIYNDNT